VKVISVKLGEVVRVYKEDEVIQIYFLKHVSGTKASIGIAAGLDWKIELPHKGNQAGASEK
jgi:hypothetical protein